MWPNTGVALAYCYKNRVIPKPENGQICTYICTGLYQMYTTQSIPVPEGYEDVFSHFYYAANRMSTPIHKTLLPSFHTVLIFSLGTPVSCSVKNDIQVVIEKTMAVGPLKHPIPYTLDPGAEILVANLKADAFYRLFGMWLQPLENVHVHTAAQNRFHEIWERLRPIPSNAEKVNALLRFYDTHLNAPKPSITEAAAEGREMPCYQRFKKAFDLLHPHSLNNAPADWPHIAQQCGYDNHGHLSHDFQHFTGISPTRYLQLRDDVCVALP